MIQPARVLPLQRSAHPLEALVIGVDHYADDRVADLPGSVRSAEGFVRALGDAGAPAEQVRLLTGSAGEGPVTRTAVLEQLRALRARLREPGRTGLLYFSGHGAYSPERGPLLCLTQAASGESAGEAFLDMPTLRELVGDLPNLTVVIDACQAGLGNSAPPGPREMRYALGLPRVLSARDADQRAFQAQFADGLHGAFSWALLNTLAQWRPRRDGAGFRFDLSYGEWVRRSQRLLSALDFPQTLVLEGGGENRAVLQAPAGRKAPTHEQPTAARIAAQLDAGEDALVRYDWTIRNDDDAKSEIYFASTFVFGAAFQEMLPKVGLPTTWPQSFRDLLPNGLFHTDHEYWFSASHWGWLDYEKPQVLVKKEAFCDPRNPSCDPVRMLRLIDGHLDGTQVGAPPRDQAALTSWLQRPGLASLEDGLLERVYRVGATTAATKQGYLKLRSIDASHYDVVFFLQPKTCLFDPVTKTANGFAYVPRLPSVQLPNHGEGWTCAVRTMNAPER